MENISSGSTFGYFFTVRSMQDVSVARQQSMRVQTPLSPCFNCNVLRESLSVDSQNIPCATLKRRVSWVTSLYLTYSAGGEDIFLFPILITTCHHAAIRGRNKTAVLLVGRGRGGGGEEPDEPGEGRGEEEDP
jgi:hypothetical protein